MVTTKPYILREKRSFTGFPKASGKCSYKLYWGIQVYGIPYITRGTNAYFSIDIKQTVDLGSHTLFIGEPTAMEVLDTAASATYAYYQDNIKPKPEAVGTTPTGQTVWRCKICGYEYVGEELPDDFICPICKHPASDFEKVTK